jgi:hypothetical protein
MAVADEARKLVVLSSGVDSLNLSAWGDLQDGVLSALAEKREQARLAGEPVRLNLWKTGTPFDVKPHGARSYSNVLTSGDMDLMVGTGPAFPPVFAELRSEFLHAKGPDLAIADLVKVLTEDLFEKEPELRASRVDLYADTQGWDLELADMRRFTCRARYRVSYREAAMQEGRRLTGLQFGRSELVGRIYDKTRELKKSGKRWLWDHWGQGVDPERPVWRIEFQFKRDVVKSFRFSDPSELLWGLQDMWRHATHTWMAYRRPTSDGRERRWPVDPIWEDVRAVQIVPAICGLIPKRSKELDEERTLRLMQGCLSSLGALRGWFSFEEAWEGSRPLVAAQFDERGRPFPRMVREKASRRLPLSVLEGGTEDRAVPEEDAA